MRGTADGQAHDNAASLRDQGTWAESRPDELFLDLQAVFTRCYDTGPYRRRVVDDPARLVPGAQSRQDTLGAGRCFSSRPARLEDAVQTRVRLRRQSFQDVEKTGQALLVFHDYSDCAKP